MSGKMLSPQVAELGKARLDFSDVDCLPSHLRDLLGDPERFSHPQVLEHAVSSSRICDILHNNPANDAMLRIVYPDSDNQPTTDGLDRFLSRSLSGQALRDRLVFCSKWIAENFLREGKRLVDLGGGSGSYAFGALGNGRRPAAFDWECIDMDRNSLELGKREAEKRGLEGMISFREANFMSEKSVDGKADFGVLIGVLCGMDEPTAVNCLRRCRLHLNPDGEVLAATLLKRSFEEDPRTFRVLCNVVGWQLRPKYEDEVIGVFRSAGYEVIDVMYERPSSPGQYAVVHARVLE